MKKRSKRLGSPKRVHVQVAIRGRGVNRLSHAALSELVERVVDGIEPPDGVTVDIHMWRGNRDLDWESTPGLKNMVRGMLQSRRIPFSLRSA